MARLLFTPHMVDIIEKVAGLLNQKVKEIREAAREMAQEEKAKEELT